MKKVAVIVTSFMLFASLSFAQTPQTQEKSKTPAAKSGTMMKKDGKDCSKTCTMKKSGCCTDKGTANKDSQAPDKK